MPANTRVFRRRAGCAAAIRRSGENVTQSLLFRERVTTLGAYAGSGAVRQAPPSEGSSAMLLDSEPGETESKRLHHESGSAILRKCPPVAGGSVDAGPVCENGSADAYVNFKAEDRQEAHVA